MREAVDTLLIIRTMRELYGTTIRAAFNNADEILCTAAKGIAEVITLTGEINVGMNDVTMSCKGHHGFRQSERRAEAHGRH